ncbi:hypothetical protein MLD38_020805 [Melastoma candidum]|uniref:Uncharacterized protein n=1 Tax=Melastoma candidum TaxID=119954 RepID=A0ACB9QE56_9MYRT|nr:hypothetical protein MLD38_020805 [Melastoma candidum]
MNTFGRLHGGAITALADRVLTACAWIIVDGDLFLGSIIQSGQSRDRSIIGSGRKATMVEVDFKIRDTEKLVNHTSATFYMTKL